MMFGYDDMWNYIIIGLILLLIIAVLVSNDATRRGHNGMLWALVVILMPMMGLFFYLIFIAISDQNTRSSRQETYNGGPRTVPVNAPQQAPVQQFEKAGDNDAVYCTSCGFANTASSVYCKKCGSAI